MLVQGTDLSDSPFLLQLGNRLLFHTKDNNVFPSDSHLHDKNNTISLTLIDPCGVLERVCVFS